MANKKVVKKKTVKKSKTVKDKLDLQPVTVKEDVKDTKRVTYNPKPKKSINIFKIIKYIKFRRKVYERMLISMQLDNGYRHHMIIFIDRNKSFVYNKKLYVVDKDYQYYNPDINLYCLDYHEGISIPIDTRLKSEDILKAVRDSGVISNIEFSLNPSLLKDFQVSTIIEKLLKGDAIDKELAFIKKLVIFNLILTIVCTLGALHIFGII